jgi:5-methyltetrahydrofolate--homocysteine methyltransferase
MVDEPAILAATIRSVQQVVDVPLAIDSSVVAALESGLKAYQGKPLVNSVTGEEERLESVLQLVVDYGAAVIGIANDETGISHNPEVRFAVAKRIVERAESFGIPREDVVIDPLAMPVGAVHGAGATIIQLVWRIHDELGVNTTCGASNVSFGLPRRPSLNATFLSMIIGAGMTCAITNPLETEMVQAILGADALLGHDENCQAWIAYYKQHSDKRGHAARRARRSLSAGRDQ